VGPPDGVLRKRRVLHIFLIMAFNTSILSYVSKAGLSVNVKMIMKGSYVIAIKLGGHDISEKSVNEKGKIDAITIGHSNELDLTVGKVIKCNGFPYRIYQIDLSRYDKSCMVLLYTRAKNVASDYIFPMFFGNLHESRKEKEYVGTFVGTDMHFSDAIPHDEPTAILVYRPKTDSYYNRFEDDKIISRQEFRHIIEIDSYQCGYVMAIPLMWQEDFYQILRGNYSKVSPAYKHYLINFYGLNEESLMHQVLSRSSTRRVHMEEDLGLPPGTMIGQELYMCFDNKREMLRKEYIIPNEKHPEQFLDGKETITS